MSGATDLAVLGNDIFLQGGGMVGYTASFTSKIRTTNVVEDTHSVLTSVIHTVKSECNTNTVIEDKRGNQSRLVCSYMYRYM